MFKLILIGCFVLLMQNSQAQTISLDSVVTAYARQDQFNGSVLVARKGVVLLNKGYGYRNAEKKISNDPESIFQIGSITKQFTSAIILKLQEEKKLNVQDKLSKYLPDYPKGDSITIEHLLLHVSGIYNYTNDGNFMANEVTRPASREKMLALFKDKPLDFSPGSGWNYSNSGYWLLGYIIEKVTGQPYEKMVRQYIFTPLQMNHSGFDFAHLQDPARTTGYFTLTESSVHTAPAVDSSVSFSAGAIYSTSGDLYRWHQALINHSILSARQQQKAYTPVKNNYGYGWVIDSIYGNLRISHTGGIPGFTTNIARIPKDDICIVLLSNASDGSLKEITNNLFAALYQQEIHLPVQRIVVQLPAGLMKQYEGEYEIRPDLHVVIRIENGDLMAFPTGQPSSKLFAEKADFFFVKEQDIQLEFRKNDKNQVDRFILYQEGRKTTCMKVK